MARIVKFVEAREKIAISVDSFSFLSISFFSFLFQINQNRSRKGIDEEIESNLFKAKFLRHCMIYFLDNFSLWSARNADRSFFFHLFFSFSFLFSLSYYSFSLLTEREREREAEKLLLLLLSHSRSLFPFPSFFPFSSPTARFPSFRALGLASISFPGRFNLFTVPCYLSRLKIERNPRWGERWTMSRVMDDGTFQLDSSSSNGGISVLFLSLSLVRPPTTI